MTRAFVLGNGPSLRETPLELLEGEVTIAMNRVDLLYEPAPEHGIAGTSWRPTHYLFFENIITGQEASARAWQPESYVIPHHIEAGEDCYISERFKRQFGEAMGWRELHGLPNVTWLPEPRCHRTNYFRSDRPEAWHLPTWCNYGGTMNHALMFAWILGYDPVILLGCDLGYQPVAWGEPDPNHFHPEYRTVEDFPLEELDPTLEHMHGLVGQVYRSAGRQILNASLETKLQAHPRMDLAEVLNGH